MYYLHLTFYVEIIIESKEPRATLVAQMNESACNAGDPGSVPGLGRSPGEGMATHSSILAKEFHGQRNLAGYSPWGHRGRHERVTVILRGICKEIFL